MKVIVKMIDELEMLPDAYGSCFFCNKKASYYLKRLGYKLCEGCKGKYCEVI